MLFKSLYLSFWFFIWLVYFAFVLSLGLLFTSFAGAMNVALVIATVLTGLCLFLQLTLKTLSDGGKL
ncbi:hypothetical protein [Leuconostoc lactis]|uniref:hypothetical protein n=1 Tax=Leuconostoc lactis TaxID=1246 RepID=UPI0031D94E0E